MNTQANEFDAVMDQWKDWQSYPWGRLFYSTSHHNLQLHLPGRPLRILDIGGGNGRDSIYFASQGHSVVLLDSSPAMLADARKQAEAQALLTKITFIEANAEQIHTLFSGQQFDLILCNLMLEFTADPPAIIRHMAHLLAPGGLLSLIDVNRYNLAIRKALLENNLSAAMDAMGAKENPHPWVHRAVPLYAAEEIIQMLRDNGCALAGQYGIWCVCPYLPNEPKYEPGYFANLERLEFQMGSTYPYYLLARFYQVIGRKADLHQETNA